MEKELVLTEKEQKRLAKLKKEIRDRERNFKKMGKAQKRVAIARDVLAQLSRGTIVAESGSWCNVLEDIRDNLSVAKLVDQEFEAHPDGYVDCTELESEAKKIIADKELRSMIIEGIASNQENCSACALGAMFTCAVLRKDDLTVKDIKKKSNSFNEFKVIKKYLGKFFSERQLNLLECAFESGGGAAGVKGEEFEAAIRYGLEYCDDRDRLVALMKNIVKNSGTFSVPKRFFREED